MKLIIRTQLVVVNDNGKESEVATDERELDPGMALNMLGNIPAPGQAVAQPPTGP